jgi:cell division protease FtsH
MEQKTQINVIYIIIAIIGVLMLQNAWVQYRAIEPLAYSDFLRELKAGNVQDIAIAANVIQGTLKKPLPDGRKKFATTRVDPELAKDLDTYGVKFSGVVENTFFKDLLSWIVPALAFAGIWFFLIRRLQDRAGGGLLAIGKSKARVYVEKDVKVTFEDVAGVDEAKLELKEVVNFLKDPARYGRLGARMPRGVLLVGPPGTGKTLLARAVAGEAGVPFFSINGSEFVEMFVGVGAARVRDLFEEARKKAPAIIFIDEIDALGRARGIYGVGGLDEKEQTLNQLLAELDGFDPRSGLVLIGATNRPEILDPALLRAGRFDRQVLVDRPERSGRVQILRVHTKKIAVAPDLDLDHVAALTPGFSGADLANLVNEAALQATRSNHEKVGTDDFTVAIERIVAGLEKRSRVLNPIERAVVAHHEMGHALVASSLPGQDPVQKISIIPRGIGALGYTLQRPTEDRYLMTRTELENKMATLLGGRAAEQLMFGELSTGAADDLVKATQIARSMVARYGMDSVLGPVVYDQERSAFLATDGLTAPPKQYAEQTAREIDLAARQLVETALQKSLKILTERRSALERGAQLLLQKETLGDAELKELLGTPAPHSVQAATAPQAAQVASAAVESGSPQPQPVRT